MRITSKKHLDNPLKILIYGLNFWPELTGIGKYTGEMSAWLVERGHEVRVVTAPPYYPDWKVGAEYRAGRYLTETWKGVRVWRAPLWVPNRPDGVKRLVHLGTFALSSLPVMLRMAIWRPQVVWLVVPAFFCAPGAWVVARLCGARCWLHLQDFEVDAAFELGLLRGGALRRLALWVESWMLRRFDRVSSISQRMIDSLREKGVSTSKLVFFPNWANVEVIAERQVQSDVDRGTNSNYRAELKIPSTSVVALYSGNMGAKQGLEILAQAAIRTQADLNLVWVFCGEGAGRCDLEAACTGLKNVRFLPLQPLVRLSELLNLADIHLLPQRGDAADLVMPSKLTGMLASGRPVVATARLGTEVAEVVSGCGISVEPESTDAFVKAVVDLASAPDQRRALGQVAREYAEAHLGRDALLARFETELKSLVKVI